MTATTFDTLKLMDRLKEAGMPEPQARVVAEAQREIVTEITQTQATELATKADLKTLEADLRAIVAEARATIIQWVAALLVAQAAAVAALVKLL